MIGNFTERSSLFYINLFIQNRNGASQNLSILAKSSFRVNRNGETMIRITPKDLSHLEEANDEIDLPSPKNFRQKSKTQDPFDVHLGEDLGNDEIEALFKEDQTPALFRGTSGAIDPQTLKRK